MTDQSDQQTPPPAGSPRVNFVTLLADGRTIVQVGFCAQDQVSLQPKPDGGQVLQISGNLPDPVTQEYDPATQTFVARLAGLRIAKIAALNRACVKVITGGFPSSALGTAATYPSMDTDQTNMMRATQVGGDLYCEQAGTWSMQAHTAAQALAVLTDFGTFCDATRAHLADLASQVNSAATPSAIAALAW